MARVKKATLRSFATSIVEALGAPQETADAVATSLVGADLRGHGSHGVLRLAYYRRLIDAGVIDPAATPTLTLSDGPTARVDGRDAFGQVVGREVAAQLVARADDHGVAAVGTADATHLGRVGEWAERVAAEGHAVVGFVNTQGGGQRVAPAGSTQRRLSTNPVVVGIPSFGALEHDIVLDMATSQVAHGKIREHRHTDEPLPPSWAVDDEGEPIRDVERFYGEEGAIRPLGGAASGYKGFGLAVAAELLAGCLGGGDVAGLAAPEHSNNAAGFLAVDLTRFLDPADAAERVDAFAGHIAGAGDDAVAAGDGTSEDDPRIPGGPEHDHQTANRSAGVPVDDEVAASLVDLAGGLGVDAPSALADAAGDR